jgi:hypothetical protein
MRVARQETEASGRQTMGAAIQPVKLYRRMRIQLQQGEEDHALKIS